MLIFSLFGTRKAIYCILKLSPVYWKPSGGFQLAELVRIEQLFRLDSLDLPSGTLVEQHVTVVAAPKTFFVCNSFKYFCKTPYDRRCASGATE